jgi:hypothetical protein
MPAEKPSRDLIAETLVRGPDHCRFRAAHVGQQCFWGKIRPEFLDQLDDSANWRCENDQVTVLAGLNRIRNCNINSADSFGVSEYGPAVTPDDLSAESSGFGGESKRTADQACADDRDLAK